MASDSMAVRQYTNKVLKLEQSEVAEIKASQVRLFDFSGQEVKREPVIMDSSPYVIDKAGFKHFLLKEIHEQPLVLRRTLGKYLNQGNLSLVGKHNGDTPAYGFSLTETEIKGIDRICIIACGTAYHAGLVGKHLLEELCNIPVTVEMASEIRGRKMLVNESTLTIAVSQSGETADTIAALEEAKKRGSFTLGITNRPDSHLGQITPNLIVTECGLEVSVAATKTYVAQLASFYLLAIHMAEVRNALTKDRA